jgi:hypothetical protein
MIQKQIRKRGNGVYLVEQISDSSLIKEGANLEHPMENWPIWTSLQGDGWRNINKICPYLCTYWLRNDFQFYNSILLKLKLGTKFYKIKNPNFYVFTLMTSVWASFPCPLQQMCMDKGEGRRILYQHWSAPVLASWKGTPSIEQYITFYTELFE